ncbi:hypothetical protein [Pedobacter sp. ASV12]|uniref:hypothetical protein n=1 Tax=Pedobacter sp. ASV12 TaxID=2795120 RepID=UPI0018EB445D|nr:hypothetical protein [Pedobacter sp. ASV12]
MNNQNEQQSKGKNALEEQKRERNQADIDSTTHLEDERTNGTTTAPTPKAVEGSQPETAKPSEGHGKTVAPNDENG